MFRLRTFCALLLFLSSCASPIVYARPDAIVIDGDLAGLTKNPTEIAFAIAHESAHIVLGHHAFDARVLSAPISRESEADAFAADTIARAGHDPCLAAAFLARFGQSERAELLYEKHHCDEGAWH